MGVTSIDHLIDETRDGMAGERANAQLFIVKLCEALDLQMPDFARACDGDNHYVFEKNVSFGALNGRQRSGRIDLYKRGCFVLESKQSCLGRPSYGPRAPGVVAVNGLRRASAPLSPGQSPPDAAAIARWRRAMTAARLQAEHYARALAEPPPFLIVLDVGHVMEVYADFSGGGAYLPFPDAARHAIRMEDLRRPDIQRRLRLIWTDPLALASELRAAPACDDTLSRYLLERTMRRLARSVQDSRRPAGEAALAQRFAPYLGLHARDGSCRMLV